ncbi:MAG: flagellar biosynthetic protein FliR [Lachnospiraceae bacterium]|nr:flagellar biosynthetic protein FliR [Lachnospiraceae bacterium]
MTVSLEDIIYFFALLVRITGFIYLAPFFSLKNVPQKVKIGLCISLALILFHTLPVTALEYETVIGFVSLIVKETLCGIIMGLFCSIAYHILGFAGQMIDMNIGFSMMNEFDPISNTQVTITANFYSYAVMLMLLVTNMHHYILTALVDSYQLIPVGEVFIRPAIYKGMVMFLVDYLVIAFRIVLPIFAAILIVNVVLAILAKVAPQMNMFVIGIQLKIFVGFIVLIFMVGLIPAVSDFIFSEMMTMLKNAIAFMKP